jgi:hypothetical protein
MGRGVYRQAGITGWRGISIGDSHTIYSGDRKLKSGIPERSISIFS